MKMKGSLLKWSGRNSMVNAEVSDYHLVRRIMLQACDRFLNSMARGKCNTTTLLVIIVFFQVYLLMQNYQTSVLLDRETTIKKRDGITHGTSIKEIIDPTLGTKTSRLNIDPCKPVEHRLFPFCQEKFEGFKTTGYWQNECYKDYHGVNGSDCSIMRYFTEIEPYCPKFSSRSHKSRENRPTQQIRNDLKGFLKLLSIDDFGWPRQRATQLWPDWRDAADRLISQKPFVLGERKKILFFLGSMGFQRDILRWAGHGGFVGELVQWTDLIASAYILGHDIKIALEGKELNSLLQPEVNDCASRFIPKDRNFDLIFTDFNGDTLLKGLGMSNYARRRCKLRVLDSFGCEAEFNYEGYTESIPGGRSPWANRDYLLQQMLTYFPHSPDNMFLGFVAGSDKVEKTVKAKDKALIYGKLDTYLQGRLPYLEVIRKHFELHATMTEKDKLIPDYIINHGVVDGKELKKLLQQSKLFIGLGFPFEGPGPLEAIANGAVFLNPKFNPPKNKMNDKFFKEKPTLRKLTSQNPYMEDFVGKPYVYTVDMNDKKAVEDALIEIKTQNKFESYLPREFTPIGMIERVHAFIQYQNLCDADAPRWPPLTSLEVYLAPEGMSCKHLCRKKGRICEPSFFGDINNLQNFKNVGITCKDVVKQNKLPYPSYNPLTEICYLQNFSLYFSCVAEESGFKRLCPCRDFIEGQTALCKSCL